MPKPYADIPGFKKLDAAIRSAMSATQTAHGELENSVAGKRTAKELAVLEKVRAELEKGHAALSKARRELWEVVETA